MAAPKGNRYAAKPRHWESALKRALSRAGNGSLADGLNLIADKVVQAAQDGDQQAWREIADRLDGKPVQTVDQHITEHVTAETLSDGELASIATGRSAGAAEAESGETEAPAVH